jgi:hypothetical protein
VTQRRRLRKLIPDAALIRRRAAGEPLRELALNYDVAHTTLLRYFERPDVARQVKLAERQLRAEQRIATDRRAAERRLEREVRRKAFEQAARERKKARVARTAILETVSRRSEYEAWLDERDARTPLTRADLHSPNDDMATRTVASGGGMQAVIDATGLGTLENVVNLIDPAILKQALDNDVLALAEHPPGLAATAQARYSQPKLETSAGTL